MPVSASTYGEVDITIDFGTHILGFDNPHKKNYHFAPLAQLYRALVFGTKGWGLESLVEHHKILYFRDI